MRVNFEVEYLPEVVRFLRELDEKTREKIFYNIAKSQQVLDSQLFKKLNDVIWEFRTQHNGFAYRLFSFWDIKRFGGSQVVVLTHGIRKTTKKTPTKEIRKAEVIRKQYLQQRKNQRHGK